MAAAQTLTAYLSATNASAAIEFYKKIFNAVETSARIADGNGVVGHATLKIGNSLFYISEEANDPQLNAKVKSPQSLGASTVLLSLLVDDVDAVIDEAVKAGAEVILRPQDQFYGHRSGRIVDPFGHVWIVATVIEQVSDDELLKRAQAYYKN